MALTPAQISFVEKYVGGSLGGVDKSEETLSSGAGPVAAWDEATKVTGAAIASLRAALTKLGQAELDRIAQAALADVLGREQTALAKAVADWNSSAQDERPGVGLRVASEVAGFRQALGKSEVVRLCEANPFGVTVDISGPLGRALDRIEMTVGG